MDNMDADVLRVFIFSLITAVATGLGAVPFLFLKSVSKRTTAFAAAIASGLMLGASFGLLLEGSEYGTWQTLIGAGAGVLFIMLGARYLSTHSEIGFGSFRGQSARRILLVVATMTAHSFAEGIAVGVAFGGGM
ncbi:MAG: ZIP family metal transporter, partial [bacterium]|nr:ZIP family metal transporter [bacterium]